MKLAFLLFEGGSKNQAFAAAAKTHFRARRPILSFLCQMAHVRGDFARIKWSWSNVKMGFVLIE